MPKILKKLWKFAIKNYFITIFFVCIAFVVVVAGYKLFISKPTYVYVKVNMGQGLWWASTGKPSLWFVKSIKKGDVQTDLLGAPIAQILSVRYYPTYIPNQYDVYLNLKLKVSGNKKTGTYSFNRSTIGVGAPIDLEFPSSQFSGTITDISNEPINDLYTEKTVYLTKTNIYDWEYDDIKIGDKFFDGEENVATILDKAEGDPIPTLSSYGSIIDATSSQIRQFATVKLKLIGKMVDGQFVFGETQIIAPEKSIYLVTHNFSFNNYTISKVE